MAEHSPELVERLEREAELRRGEGDVDLAALLLDARRQIANRKCAGAEIASGELLESLSVAADFLDQHSHWSFAADVRAAASILEASGHAELVRGLIGAREALRPPHLYPGNREEWEEQLRDTGEWIDSILTKTQQSITRNGDGE